MDRHLAIAAMAAPAPGVERHPQPPLDGPFGRVAARMPALAEAHELVRDLQFLAIGLLQAAGDRKVLRHHVVRIHPQRGGEVVQRAHGEEGRLRMVGRPPGPRAGAVRGHRRVLVLAVGDLEDVGQRRIPGASRAARAPGLRRPGGERAVLLGPHLDLGERRRAVAGHGQLGVTVEHHLDRRVGQLGELRADDPPAVDVELAAEAAADVVRDHPHVGGRDAEPFGELRGGARDRLRGAPGGEMVGLRPVADLAVGLHAVVGHGGREIAPLDLHLGGGEGARGVPLGLLLAGIHLRGGRQLLLGDEVRQHLVLHLDRLQGRLGERL